MTFENAFWSLVSCLTVLLTYGFAKDMWSLRAERKVRSERINRIQSASIIEPMVHLAQIKADSPETVPSQDEVQLPDDFFPSTVLPHGPQNEKDRLERFSKSFADEFDEFRSPDATGFPNTVIEFQDTAMQVDR